ncbi:hypothetical protein [Kitasatospora sp. NPDC001095]
MKSGRTLRGLAAGLAFAAAAVVPAAMPAQAQSVCTGPTPSGRCDVVGEGNDPTGALLSVARVPGGLSVSGWAQDVDGGSVTVRISVGGVPVGYLSADRPGGPDGRSDAFTGVVPVPTATGTVCAAALNIGSGADAFLGCSSLLVGHDPIGKLDTFTTKDGSVTATGWALDPDSAASTQVYISYQGNTFGPFPADQARPDVGAAYPGYGDAHGYRATFTPPSISACYWVVKVTAVSLEAGSNAQVAARMCS